MLVPFVIDADSLAPDPAWTPAQLRACHNTLFEVWQRIGLLVHDGDHFEDSNLYRAVQDLPQKLRPLWQAMLERAPPVSCANGWCGAVSATSVQELYGVASVALVEDVRAEEEFGISVEEDEKFVRPPGGVGLDVCRLLAANQAKAFKEAISKSGTQVEAGETYNAIWEQRFRALAAAPIKRISVVDRYAVERHWRCPQSQLSGLERFLKLLDKDAGGGRNVSLFSAWTPDLADKTAIKDIESELRSVIMGLPKRNIKRLELYMVPNARFGGDSHDRYVRFDRYVWDLGLGLEIFEGPAAAKRSAASFKAGDSSASYRRVEDDLAGHAWP